MDAAWKGRSGDAVAQGPDANVANKVRVRPDLEGESGGQKKVPEARGQGLDVREWRKGWPAFR